MTLWQAAEAALGGSTICSPCCLLCLITERQFGSLTAKPSAVLFACCSSMMLKMFWSCESRWSRVHLQLTRLAICHPSSGLLCGPRTIGLCARASAGGPSGACMHHVTSDWLLHPICRLAWTAQFVLSASGDYASTRHAQTSTTSCVHAKAITAPGQQLCRLLSVQSAGFNDGSAQEYKGNTDQL